MTKKLEDLISAGKKAIETPQALEEQRRSFAYGNTKIENPRITRQTIDREAESLRKQEK